MKFNFKSFILNGFTDMITKDKNIYNYIKEFDYITFVPMTKNKEIRRGYNQSKVLAQKIGEKTNIKCIEALIKIKENKVQSSLDKIQRFNNVKNVYEINKTFDLKDKRIVLIDDILTTGATIEECSNVLKENEVKNICIIVMAKA